MKKIGAQSPKNHIGWMKDIDAARHGRKLTDDAIRVLLKKSLFDYYCDQPFCLYCSLSNLLSHRLFTPVIN
jgi:hypothetical protein